MQRHKPKDAEYCRNECRRSMQQSHPASSSQHGHDPQPNCPHNAHPRHHRCGRVPTCTQHAHTRSKRNRFISEVSSANSRRSGDSGRLALQTATHSRHTGGGGGAGDLAGLGYGHRSAGYGCLGGDGEAGGAFGYGYLRSPLMGRGLREGTGKNCTDTPVTQDKPPDVHAMA